MLVPTAAYLALAGAAASTWNVASASSIAASAPLRRGSERTKSLLSKARRLDEDEDEENAFLRDYKVKFRRCINERWVGNDGDGNDAEQNVAIFRLCPVDTCDGDDEDGCDSGYGDYVVGLNTFMEAYFRELEEQENQNNNNNNNEEEFDLMEYSECREYENENDDDNDVQYFLTVNCTEDGDDVQLDLFRDENCMYLADEGTFETLSGGKSLRYYDNDGSLMFKGCKDCYGMNENGEYEISEFCGQIHEDSGKCETEMETVSAENGRVERACEYIQELTYEESGPSAGKIIFWICFALIACFGIFFFLRMRRKAKGAMATTNQDGLLS